MIGPKIRNVMVTDNGRTYRIASMGVRVLVVALKLPTGGERTIDPKGQRARQLIKKARQL